MLPSLDWQLVTDVSGQLIGLKLKGHAVQESKDLIYTTAEA
jgi:hypothetical protein